MNTTVLTVPGYHGSGDAHWQTWLEETLPGSRRVTGIDWESPVLINWAIRIQQEIDAATKPVLIVAHSFGCLASVIAASNRPEKVAGVILVAPANPERFSPLGLRDPEEPAVLVTVADLLPRKPLPLTGLVIASRNDPWISYASAQEWVGRWGFGLYNAGMAGHINSESGYGPWPLLIELIQAMRAAVEPLPLGAIDRGRRQQQGRGGLLAKIRLHTRQQLAYL